MVVTMRMAGKAKERWCFAQANVGASQSVSQARHKTRRDPRQAQLCLEGARTTLQLWKRLVPCQGAATSRSERE